MDPLRAQISAASVQGMVATGDRASRRVRRRLTDPEDGVRSGALCYASRGFSLHAATRIEATYRRRLERICRYVIRPPVASGRLRFVDAQTLVFSLKTHWADGTCQLVLSPQELLEKLTALVPPPRLNLARYHGVLAPACPDRTRAQSPDTAGRRPKWAARSSGFMGQVAGQSVSVRRHHVSQLRGADEDHCCSHCALCD